MASTTYHEPSELLSENSKDLHRAIVSLMEELEAIDWYQQRAEATQDLALRAVLEHNRNEETEHAMMVLEWLRRASPAFDAHIRTYLMKEGPITGLEALAKRGTDGDVGGQPNHEALSAGGPGGSLGVGSLRPVPLAPTSTNLENT
ncbi:MAG TPA: ferritin-like domain-containing protein [Polyangiaceae bacterium]|nr:ferritin-like domain-containing protein [Polyangiaceae bacterium]